MGGYSKCWSVPVRLHDVTSLKTVVLVFTAVRTQIFIIGDGGGGEDMYLKCMEKYNHARHRWITMTPMHEARASFGCAALDEFVYVMGGYDGKFYLKSVER
jgi:hypothetical protein